MIRLLVLLALPFLFAFTFSPMSQSIQIGEGQKGSQFLIENESSANIAVELSVKSREMNEKGEETLTDTKDISVFPPQIIIPPGEKRTIRVTYNNKDLPELEKNYRVIAEQLPLKVDAKTKDQGGVKMLMKFVAALYVSPAGAKSDVKLVDYNSTGNELKLVVENSGKLHQLLSNPVIKYLHKGKKGEIKSEDLPGFAGENVLAGHKRTFIIKTSKSIPQDAKVELSIHE